MTNRREFLRIGLASSALPLVAPSPFAAAGHARAAVPVHEVLYDIRFPASVAFARREAPQPLLGVAARATAEPAWAAAMADVVPPCPSMRVAGTARVATPGGERAAAAEPLFSWLIAPVARAK